MEQVKTQMSMKKQETFKKNKLNTIESVNENLEETEARMNTTKEGKGGTVDLR